MNIKLQTTNYKLPTGFTLVETLIAVVIMTLAVSGPLYTANRAIVAAEVSRDQLIASYLAQEGIEHVRSMRDNEYLAVYNQPSASTVAWTRFLAQASIGKCVAPAVCTFDPAGSGTVQACSGACRPLYLSAKKVYTQTSGGTITPFTRTIQATAVTASDEQITSRVTWSFKGSQYSVTIVEHLTPWQ